MIIGRCKEHIDCNIYKGGYCTHTFRIMRGSYARMNEAAENKRLDRAARCSTLTVDRIMREEIHHTDPLIYGAYIPCGGRCGKTRESCLKAHGYCIDNDDEILKHLDKRYHSWMQTIKNGSVQLTKNEFNKIIF